MAKNRQINTSLESTDSQKVILEALSAVQFEGKKLAPGDKKEVDKATAKKILRGSKDKFRITMA